MGIHFDTFQLTDEGMDGPIKDLKKAMDLSKKKIQFSVLKNGESLSI